MSFRTFLEQFISIWESSSLSELKKVIDMGYLAREIRNGETVDFGYVESIIGWKQGFDFVKEKNAVWEIKEISVIPLKEDEMMAILSATLIIDGNPLDTANLFFDTFKIKNNEWKLVRSYIESGVSQKRLQEV